MSPPSPFTTWTYPFPPYRNLAIVARDGVVLRDAPGPRVLCSKDVYVRCIAMTAAAALANCTVESRTREVLEALDGALPGQRVAFRVCVVSPKARLEVVDLVARGEAGTDGEACYTILLAGEDFEQ